MGHSDHEFNPLFYDNRPKQFCPDQVERNIHGQALKVLKLFKRLLLNIQTLIFSRERDLKPIGRRKKHF